MIYKAGDAVPTDWFSKLENVTGIHFASDCDVQIIDGRRVVTRAGDGPYLIYFDGNDGAHMDVETAIPMVIHNTLNQQIARKQ